MLATVRLEGYGDRKPVQLSGGQRQRVALARAIVNRPKVLLLDEPLGALDLKLRQEMQVFLKSLQHELGMTFLYVTHDQEEALTMSTASPSSTQGRIEQIGTPTEIYERPATEFVADFVGTSNILERDGRRLVLRPERIAFARRAASRRRSTTSSSSARSRATPSPPTAASSSTVLRQNDGPTLERGTQVEPRLARRGRVPASEPRTTGGQMSKRTWAAFLVLAAALAFPAAGVSKSERRHAEHDRVGGLHAAAVGEAVREEHAAAR